MGKIVSIPYGKWNHANLRITNCMNHVSIPYGKWNLNRDTHWIGRKPTCFNTLWEMEPKGQYGHTQYRG